MRLTFNNEFNDPYEGLVIRVGQTVFYPVKIRTIFFFCSDKGCPPRLVIMKYSRITDMLNKPLKIADMGCGCGNSTLAMASIFPQANVHGLDIDKESIAKAIRNINHPNITFTGKSAYFLGTI